MKQGLKLIWRGIKECVKAYCRCAESIGWYNWNIYGRNYSTDVK